MKFIFLLLLSISANTFAQAPYNSEITQSPLVRGAVSLSPDCTLTPNPFSNCSFESGDFTDWVLTDFDTADQFIPTTVVAPGASSGFGFFLTAPTQGAFSVFAGFDGNGPGAIELAQDVTLPAGSGSVIFDFRAAGDLATFGAVLNRDFRVEVQPSGGGAALQSDLVFSLVAGETLLDSGILQGNVNVSAFSGQAVRIAFVLDIPEPFSGPAQLELDNVSLELVVPPPAIPALTLTGLALTAAMLLVFGLLMVRRKQNS